MSEYNSRALEKEERKRATHLVVAGSRDLDEGVSWVLLAGDPAKKEEEGCKSAFTSRGGKASRAHL